MLPDLTRGWRNPETGYQPPRLGLDPRPARPKYGEWEHDYADTGRTHIPDDFAWRVAFWAAISYDAGCQPYFTVFVTDVKAFIQGMKSNSYDSKRRVMDRSNYKSNTD